MPKRIQRTKRVTQFGYQPAAEYQKMQEDVLETTFARIAYPLGETSKCAGFITVSDKTFIRNFSGYFLHRSLWCCMQSKVNFGQACGI
jgi:hypothetical protein